VHGPGTDARSPVVWEGATLITQTQSPPLSDIIYMINKKSINLYTEHLLRAIGLQVSGEGSERAGIKAVLSFLDEQGIPTGGVHLYDGCGLAPADRITPQTMVGVLQYAARQPWFRQYYHSFAIAGDTADIGYFRHYGAGTRIQDNARIKSGLITDVRSLSGYIHDRKGRLIVFSFITNNHDGRARQVDELFRKVLVELAGLR
jgi:D-alanyl-D-alanine carboxypeptidase/D-alanyl-D-alanine-endopeptidase (penicillin-binding protein 4)